MVPTAQPALVKNIEDYDVELVAAPPPGKEAPPLPSAWHISRRDWVFMGIGAGAVIAAGCLGIGLRWLNQPASDE